MPLYKKILLGVGVCFGSIVFFLVVIFVGVSIYTSGLKDPIEKQLVSIRAEDMATAYSYTTTNFQKNTSLEAFSKFVNDYSGLRNNESISYDERSIENGIGTVNAQLKSRSGVETPILYKLIKVNNKWRIETMVINPGQSSSANEKSTPTSSPITKKSVSDVVLNNTYQDPKYKYTIQYPADWQYSQKNPSLVIFKGKEGTQSAQSSFLVQAFKQGRRHQSVQQIVVEARKEIGKDTTGMKIIEEGPMPTISGDSKYEGQYTVYSYNINNQPFGHLEVISFSGLTRILYILDYIAPPSQFEKNLPIAKAMIISFAIRK
jgi:hypothetical protein